MHSRTPNTFVIGAGPVATTLAGALRLGGVPVLGLWARKPAAARNAGVIAGVAAYSAAPPDLLLEAEILLVAVRDDAISDVAEKLVGTGLVNKRHTMLHCSGVLSAEEAFASVRDHLGGIGTMHPLRAIADPKRTLRELAGTVFGIEGDSKGRAAALALVQSLHGNPLQLGAGQMAAYHAAAAMASNYLVALLDASAALLETAGIDEKTALEALLPLVRGSVDNVSRRGIDAGLTGPIRRGDAGTVSRHLAALAEMPQIRAVYTELGRCALAIARRANHAPVSDLDAIDRLLDDTETAEKTVETADNVESNAYPA